MARRTTARLVGAAVALMALLVSGTAAVADPNLPLPSRVERFLDLLREVSPLAGDLRASAFRRSDSPSVSDGADRLDLLLGAHRTLYLAGGAEEQFTIEGPDGTIVVPRPLAPGTRVAADWEAVLTALAGGGAGGDQVDHALLRIGSDPIAAADFRTHLLRGFVGYARGDGSALGSFEAAREAAERDLPSRILLGLLHLQSGAPAKAIQPLAEAIRIAPGNATVRELLADANLRVGRPVRSIQLLEPLVRADPGAARPGLLLARSLLAAHRPRDALARLALVSGDAEIRFAADCLAARAHLVLGQTESALLRARSAATREPGNLLPRTLEAMAHAGAGRTAEALALTQALTSSNPDVPMVWRTHALICEKHEDLEGAEAAARRWLSLSPGSAAPVLLLARILEEAGKPDAAVPYLRKLIEQEPRRAAAHRQLGSAYLAAGDEDQARECFRAFLQISPNGPAATQVRKILEGLAATRTGSPK